MRTFLRRPLLVLVVICLLPVLLLPLAVVWTAAWLLAQYRHLSDQRAHGGQNREEQVESRAAALQANEQQLATQADRLAAIVNAAHEAIISADLDGTIISVNHSAEELYGVPAAFAVGRSIADLVLSENMVGFEAMLARVGAGEVVAADDTPWRLPDGTTKMLAVSISPIYDGSGQVTSFAAFAREVTERRSAERALAASERKYRELYDHSPDMYMSGYPADHLIRECNLTLAETLGYTREELLGQPNSKLFTPTSYTHMLAVLPQYMASGEYLNLEVQLQCTDGTVIDALMSGYLEPATAASPAYSRVTFHDITARKRLENQLRDSEQKWRSVFEFLPVGVSIVNSKDQVSDTNAALAQILAMTPEGILQGAYAHRRYFHPNRTPMRPDEFPSLRALTERQVVRDVVIGVEKEDGDIIWVSVSATPESLDGYALTVTTDITARKRLEDALAAGEARLRAVIENTADSVWSVDRGSRLLVGNSVFARGVQQQIGRPLAPGESVVSDPFPPSARAFWQPLYDRALAGESFMVEMPSSLRPGGTLACYLHPIRAADGTIAGVSGRAADITALKQVAAELHEAYQRLRLAADAANIGVWNWNFADDRLEWDDRICDFYAVPRAMRTEGIYYAVWQDRVHPDDLAANEASLAAARRDGTEWSSTFRIVLPDGQVRHIYSACVVEQDEDGAPLRMVGINRDVTDQKRYEQILQDANAVLEEHVAARTAELRTAIADLQRANGLKDEFLAMISHELRTPLMGVLSMSEMLEERIAGPLNDRQTTYVKNIVNSGERLLNVVNSILGYTHLLSGKVQINAEPCELVYLLEACANSQRYKAAERQHTIAVRVEPPDLLINGDGTAIGEVLKRLLHNAIKFTPEGGQIGLEARPGAAPLTIDLVVWDTGIGIAPDQIDHVFHAFTQGDGRLARSHEGIGLGLAYVDQMVRLMGGTLHLASELGHGSRFTITLPAALAA